LTPKSPDGSRSTFDHKAQPEAEEVLHNIPYPALCWHALSATVSYGEPAGKGRQEILDEIEDRQGQFQQTSTRKSFSRF